MLASCVGSSFLGGDVGLVVMLLYTENIMKIGVVYLTDVYISTILAPQRNKYRGYTLIVSITLHFYALIRRHSYTF